MICPRCQGELFEAVKNGVAIDHCPECKGIWLDQGELAKIIAHMKQVEASLEAELRSPREPRESCARHREDRRYDKHYDKRRSKKKFGLERLFEIFD